MNRNRVIAAVIAVAIVIALIGSLIVAATSGDTDSSTTDTAASTSTAPDSSTTSAPDTTTSTTSVPETTTTTEAPAEVLRILVTNDDGIESPGIDALVIALTALPDVEVTVVAPAENASGSGDMTTDQSVDGPLVATETTTTSGYPATAIAGFPADSIVWAIDEGGLAETPHVVVSGSNEGQNLGPIAEVSGTVGAARTAARRGIPALAVSQGLADAPDFPASVGPAAAWVSEHRAALLDGSADADVVTKIDAPTCIAGAPKEVVDVPLAVDIADREIFVEVDCTVESGPPADDIDAFLGGYVARTTFDPELSVLTG